MLAVAWSMLGTAARTASAALRGFAHGVGTPCSRSVDGGTLNDSAVESNLAHSGDALVRGGSGLLTLGGDARGCGSRTLLGSSLHSGGGRVLS